MYYIRLEHSAVYVHVSQCVYGFAIALLVGRPTVVKCSIIGATLLCARLTNHHNGT